MPAVRITYVFNAGKILAAEEAAWVVATKEVALLAREKAPYSTNPGRQGPHLRNTIFARAVGPVKTLLWASSPHARMVEYGRGEVTPKKAKALRWFGPDGEPIFSMHSGPAKAQPFMRPAAAAFPTLFKRALAASLRKIA